MRGFAKQLKKQGGTIQELEQAFRRNSGRIDLSDIISMLPKFGVGIEEYPKGSRHYKLINEETGAFFVLDTHGTKAVEVREMTSILVKLQRP